MIVIPNPTNESIQLSISVVDDFQRLKYSWHYYYTKFYHFFKELFSIGIIKRNFAFSGFVILFCQIYLPGRMKTHKSYFSLA
jgi:hypothetical protein